MANAMSHAFSLELYSHPRHALCSCCALVSAPQLRARNALKFAGHPHCPRRTPLGALVQRLCSAVPGAASTAPAPCFLLVFRPRFHASMKGKEGLKMSPQKKQK